MAEVPAASVARNFRPVHVVGGVFGVFDVAFLDRGAKGWPAAAGIVFGLGGEQFIAAGGTQVVAFGEEFVILAAESGFCAFFSQYPVLCGREGLSPFGVGSYCFFCLIRHVGISQFFGGGRCFVLGGLWRRLDVAAAGQEEYGGCKDGGRHDANSRHEVYPSKYLLPALFTFRLSVNLRIVAAVGSFVKDSVMVAGFGGRTAILPALS